jgi:hypothetical protein
MTTKYVYQKVKKTPNDHKICIPKGEKHTKWPKICIPKWPFNIPSDNKVYQNGQTIYQVTTMYTKMAVKCTKYSIPIYTNWDFWFANLTSGNPCRRELSRCLFCAFDRQKNLPAWLLPTIKVQIQRRHYKALWFRIETFKQGIVSWSQRQAGKRNVDC